MTHKTNTSKTAAAVVSVQMTQADAIGAKGQALSNTRIYIIDALGAPTGAIMESGVAGAVPVSGGGGSGAPAIVPLWTAATALDAGAQVRATVAVGGFIVGEYISSNSSRTTGATFDATEAGNFTSVPEDTTVLKKSDVVNNLTSTATDVPLSAAQGKVLQDNKTALATTGTPAMNGVAALGVAVAASASDHVHPSDTTKAPLASPTFTGTIIGDGLVRLGNGQNVGDSGTAIADATTVFPNAASTASTTIATTDTALRVSRPGTTGTKWGNTLDVNIGSHTAGLNSQTQVDFRLNNGGTNLPDMTALTLRGDGQVLLNSNPTATLGAATKQYVDGLLVGLLDYRGAFTPAVSSGATGYPTTGGSGSAGAILKGDVYFASAAGFILTEAIQAGDSVVAKIDTPGQTAANWDKLNVNISYVPEDAANKVIAFSSPTDTQYPSAKLTFDQLALKQATLVSGTSIKTVNGTTLLGAGDIQAAVTLTNTVLPTLTGAATLTTNTVLAIASWGTQIPVSAAAGDVHILLPTAVSQSGQLRILRIDSSVNNVFIYAFGLEGIKRVLANTDAIRLDALGSVTFGIEANAPAILAWERPKQLYRLWTPGDLTLHAWYKAGDFVLGAGSAIAQWNDSSGNAYHLTQATTTSRPANTNTLNGINTLTYDGGDHLHYVHGSDWSINCNAVTFYGVSNRPNANGNHTDFAVNGQNSSTNRIQTHLRWTSDIAYFDLGGTGATGRISLATTAFADGNWKIISARRGRSTVDAVDLAHAQARANGTDIITGTTLTSAGSLVFRSLNVGSEVDGANIVPNATQQAEYIVALEAHTNANRDNIEGYLAHKLGLKGSMNAAHAYKVAAPLVSLVAF